MRVVRKGKSGKAHDQEINWIDPGDPIPEVVDQELFVQAGRLRVPIVDEETAQNEKDRDASIELLDKGVEDARAAGCCVVMTEHHERSDRPYTGKRREILIVFFGLHKGLAFFVQRQRLLEWIQYKVISTRSW